MLKTCERVLVIEGEKNTLDLITSTLSFEGFKVISAANGLEGLKLIKTHDPDVVITRFFVSTWQTSGGRLSRTQMSHVTSSRK